MADEQGEPKLLPTAQCCDGGACHPTEAGGPVPPAGLSRRGFVALGAVTAAGLGLRPEGAVAVPATKGLTESDFEEFSAPGRPTEYSGEALRNIGMPVGGLAAGQVYLSGDGRLWLWDVFNPPGFPAGGADWQGRHYADPLRSEAATPFATGFAVRWSGPSTQGTRSLDDEGFDRVGFRGRYPLGQVSFRDRDVPLQVSLDAFSPFVPTAAADSSFPATVFEYTVRNTSQHTLSLEILGFAENPVCLRSRRSQPVALVTDRFATDGVTGLQHAARDRATDEPRPDILFEDWERTDYTGWTVSGSAFGEGPVTEEECPGYFRREGPLQITGTRFVTSHNFRNSDPPNPDDHRGELLSEPFVLERRYVAVNVGGGSQPGSACVNVLIDGRVVASFTGRNHETHHAEGLDVSEYEGRTATLQILDEATGGWGHINCDRIWFTDTPVDPRSLDELPDNGTFALAAMDGRARVRPSVADVSTPDACFDSADAPPRTEGTHGTTAGTVTVPFTLRPGASTTVRFVLAWHFDLVDRQLFGRLSGADKLRRHYGTVFGDARAVTRAVAARGEELSAATRGFVHAWYEDSTLPQWFLERTLAPASTAATSTVWRFQDGRFYAWEGVFCCEGTCTHVWNYAQSLARLFPELERDTRERVDFGLAFHPETGAVDYRGEYARHVAHDGQCGNVLRACREHQMSADDSFLRRVWPLVKKATEFLIRADGEPDGILEGAQYNTLDSTWYGEIPWISGLYVAALRAAALMADDMGDTAFAARCRSLADRGSASLDEDLWNSRYGYFEQQVDPGHTGAINSNRGCHLDQMFGQTYAHQLGLPRVFPRDKARTALSSMYRYNFLPDAQSYKEESEIPGGRVFSTAGEAGTVMCTWPFGGARTAPGDGAAFAVGYFNEVWTGQEYQFAAHLLAEGMVEEGLAVTRAVHDRYTAGQRNPYNEIECSDHYARAMMSHAVYLAALGFEYHGPRGHIGFIPRVRPEDFAAAFTAAEGWGLYRQQRTGKRHHGEIALRYGRLRIRSVASRATASEKPMSVELVGPGVRREPSVAGVETDGERTVLTLADEVTLEPGMSLHLRS